MTTTAKRTSNGTLTELQRQDAYLAELPKDFEFPLFSGRQAVESQRKSGYKTTAHAARELVDNAIEAGAKNVWFAFDRIKQAARKKHQRKDTTTAIAVIDDGPGMRRQMARAALSWGGGTHTDDPDFIAKFGFGLPNSSINQTRRVEVYTKNARMKGWARVVLDINNLPRFGLVTIPDSEKAELPKFVTAYLKRRAITLKSGTVVVWDKPDRLTYTQATMLKQHLRHDFGVAYRYLLDDFNLIIEDDLVKQVDPLFLSPDGLFYQRPEDNGAKCTFDKQLIVKYWRDETTGASNLAQLNGVEELDAAQRDPHASVGVIEVRIARFPYGFVRGEKQHKGTDAYKRFQFRKNRRGISFVRAGREIDTLDAFPRSAADEASGLGDWPLLQSYAYHWGIEIRFAPQLDDAFGIGNDKQTVRPIEDFWRVLHKAEIDRAARLEDRYQKRARRKKQGERAEKQAASPERPNPATEAAAQAEMLIGLRALPDERKKEARKLIQQKTKERSQETGEPVDEAKRALEGEAKRKRFAIGFFEADGGVFYKPDYGNGLQRVAMINRAHPFFQLFYAQLAKIPDPRPREAVDLLLLSLAQAELQTDGIKRTTYEHERAREWSPFLANSLKILEQLERELEDDEDDL